MSYDNFPDREYDNGHVFIQTPNGTLILDEEDEDILTQYRWHVKIWTGKRSLGNKYVYERYSGKGIKQHFLHRIIMNAKDGEFIDHINGDTLDNRKSNLRIATRSQNQQNSRRRSHCKSKFKGVHYTKKVKKSKYGKIYTYYKWVASISVDGKNIQRTFNNEIEAARAYNELAKEHFGEFAYLNDV